MWSAPYILVLFPSSIMEHLGQRHPILIKIMTSSIDDKTLVTLKKVSRGLYEFLEEERFYWLRVIQSYDENNIEQSKSWKKLVDKTPSQCPRTGLSKKFLPKPMTTTG